jgi:hypothetical protein
MKISTAIEPFPLSPSQRARRNAFAILNRAARDTDLATQAQNLHHVSEIGGISTRWSRLPYEGAPSYIATKDGGIDRIILMDTGSLNVGIFDGHQDLWRRRVLTCLPELVLATLPKASFAPFDSRAIASPIQLNTIIRLLNLPPTVPLPRLHAAVASLVIQQIVFSKVFVKLVSDFRTWTEATLDEHAA